MAKLPSKGGSYTRKPNGGLERNEEAAPKTDSKPKADGKPQSSPKPKG